MPEAIAPVEHRDTLGEGLRSLGVALPAGARAKIDAHLALLAKWNRVYNLTAIREPARMVTHHVLDSLAALPALDRLASRASGLRLLDVGSGAGFPGIPLALARPAWQVTLVESNQKKAAFLTQATIEIGLANVEVVLGRVDDMHAVAPFDIVISRAFADLAAFVAVGVRHLAAGGVLVAMKGGDPVDERAALPVEIEAVETIALCVPGLDAARHLVVMRPREGNTATR